MKASIITLLWNNEKDYSYIEYIVENDTWVEAKATVFPGVKLKTHSVLAVGSIATKDLESYGIYQGNPAVKKRDRVIK